MTDWVQGPKEPEGPENAAVDERPYVHELEEYLARYRRDLAAERARRRRQIAVAFGREQELTAKIQSLEKEGAEAREREQQLSQRVAQLTSELDAAHAAIQTTRDEVRAWKQAHDAAQEGIRYLQQELTRWSTSKWGRMASLYWRARARLGRLMGSSKVPKPASTAGDGDVVKADITTESGHARGGSSAMMAPKRQITVPEGFLRAAAGRDDIVVLSIIDWEFRFQRPQQLAVQFGRHGHRVFYLSTSKFLKPKDRPARLELKDTNVAELVVRSRQPLNIYSGSLSADDLDVLQTSFESLAAEMGMGDTTLMVQIPFWEPLARRLHERLGWRVVYDCMDEWTNFPGFGEDVLNLEDTLAREAELTVVSGETLVGKFEGKSRHVLLAKNAVDVQHYHTFYKENELLAGLDHPIIGYFGALAAWADVPLLEKIVDTFPHAQIVLAGGVFDIDLENLRKRPNVHLLGQRPYEEMPQLLWHFDVCMIPFQINDITHATNPVKLYEYFYSGKPVVAPALHELEPFREECYLAESHEAFLDGLDRALKEPEDDPRRERRRRVAADNDWSERYRAIHRELIEAQPRVSIVIVTYGGLEHTRRCLASLEQETWPQLEIIVVDNYSPDGSAEYLQTYAAEHARVNVIFNQENRGFAAANNQGLQRATGDILVLLNNDTIVPPGLVGRLVRHLENDRELGLLCPTTNFCGNEARVEPWYDDPADIPRYASWRAVTFAGQTFDLSVAAMYCVAMRRDVFEAVGPLDEQFGLGMFEDDDYSLRVRQAGFRVAYAEDAYVHHVGQAAFGQLAPEEYQRIWEQNQAYFEKKWGRPWQPHTPRPGVRAVSSRVGTQS